MAGETFRTFHETLQLGIGFEFLEFRGLEDLFNTLRKIEKFPERTAKNYEKDAAAFRRGIHAKLADARKLEEGQRASINRLSKVQLAAYQADTAGYISGMRAKAKEDEKQVAAAERRAKRWTGVALLSKFGVAGFVAGGAALAGSALLAANERQRLRQVGAVTGVGLEDLERYNRVGWRMATRYGTDAIPTAGYGALLQARGGLTPAQARRYQRWSVMTAAPRGEDVGEYGAGMGALLRAAPYLRGRPGRTMAMLNVAAQRTGQDLPTQATAIAPYMAMFGQQGRQNFGDMLASVAYMQQLGLDPAALRRVIGVVQAPGSKRRREDFQRMTKGGYNIQANLQTGGIYGMIGALRQSGADKATLQELFGSRGYQAVNALAFQQYGGYGQMVGAIGGARPGDITRTARAFADQPAIKFQAEMQKLQKSLIDVGAEVLPEVNKSLKDLMPQLDKFARWLHDNRKAIGQWVSDTTSGIGNFIDASQKFGDALTNVASGFARFGIVLHDAIVGWMSNIYNAVRSMPLMDKVLPKWQPGLSAENPINSIPSIGRTGGGVIGTGSANPSLAVSRAPGGWQSPRGAGTIAEFQMGRGGYYQTTTNEQLRGGKSPSEGMVEGYVTGRAGRGGYNPNNVFSGSQYHYDFASTGRAVNGHGPPVHLPNQGWYQLIGYSDKGIPGEVIHGAGPAVSHWYTFQTPNGGLIVFGHVDKNTLHIHMNKWYHGPTQIGYTTLGGHVHVIMDARARDYVFDVLHPKNRRVASQASSLVNWTPHSVQQSSTQKTSAHRGSHRGVHARGGGKGAMHQARGANAEGRPAGMPQNVWRWRHQIMAASKKYGVPANVIAGDIFGESGGDPTLINSIGATGLMQVMPSTAAGYGYSQHDMLQPGKNIDVGTQVLAYRHNKLGYSWTKAYRSQGDWKGTAPGAAAMQRFRGDFAGVSPGGQKQAGQRTNYTDQGTGQGQFEKWQQASQMRQTELETFFKGVQDPNKMPRWRRHQYLRDFHKLAVDQFLQYKAYVNSLDIPVGEKTRMIASSKSHLQQRLAHPWKEFGGFSGTNKQYAGPASDIGPIRLLRKERCKAEEKNTKHLGGIAKHASAHVKIAQHHSKQFTQMNHTLGMIHRAIVGTLPQGGPPSAGTVQWETRPGYG